MSDYRFKVVAYYKNAAGVLVGTSEWFLTNEADCIRMLNDTTQLPPLPPMMTFPGPDHTVVGAAYFKRTGDTWSYVDDSETADHYIDWEIRKHRARF